MKRPRILVIGDLSTVCLTKAERFPTPGMTLTAESVTHLPGGTGGKVAVALQRLGGECLLCAKVGDDPYAEELKDFLAEEKIDVRFVGSAPETATAFENVIRNGSGEEMRLTCHGAAESLDAYDVEDSFICYPDALILMGAAIPPDAAEMAVSYAHDVNIPFFVLTAGRQGLPLPGFAGCEVFSADEEETLMLTGIPPADQERCMKACIAFKQLTRARYVVLRLGERGCFLFDGMYHSFLPAYDVEAPKGENSEAVFGAAMVREYLISGGDSKKACETGLLAAAYYLKKGGGFAAYPTDKELLRFAEENGVESPFQEKEEE